MSALEFLRVAALFSGGDAPGMNPFLRALVCLGLSRHAAAVLGVKSGYAGLVRTCLRLSSGELTMPALEEELTVSRGMIGVTRRSQSLVWLDRATVESLLDRGGIILGSSRCEEFHRPEVRRQVIEFLKALGVTTLVVCGGNGSLAGAVCLSQESDLQVIGVPATIDNDLPVTEVALGFETALQTLVQAIRHFNDTAASHHRIMLLETMGRDSGELARLAALASGAEIVLVPERGPLDQEKMEHIARRLERSLDRGADHAIVLVAEGVRLEPPAKDRPTERFALYLQEYFRRPESRFPQLETRTGVLGHLQRGGSPSVADRILAARFAEAVWEAVAESGRPSGIVAVQRGRVGLRAFSAASEPERIEAARKGYLLQKALSRR
jgi:6-phosphofructokinase 1